MPPVFENMVKLSPLFSNEKVVPEGPETSNNEVEPVQVSRFRGSQYNVKGLMEAGKLRKPYQFEMCRELVRTVQSGRGRVKLKRTQLPEDRKVLLS